MIKTIQSTQLRANFSQTLDLVKKSKKPLIITERGVPTSVLVSIDEYEDFLDEKNTDLIASIKKVRKEIEKGEVLTFSDVFGNV
jgi:prevent-host-death family protein